YWEFGSGCVLPATGIVMQNRGASFSLDPKALNVLAPGRRAFHTLNPAIGALKDKRIIAYGTMGGDGQPQSQAAVFTRHVTFGQPLEQHSMRLAGFWGEPGAQRTPICGWSRVSTGILWIVSCPLATMWPFSTTLIRIRWVTRERWCCTRTAPWKAVMIRALTAVRRASDPPRLS